MSLRIEAKLDFYIFFKNISDAKLAITVLVCCSSDVTFNSVLLAVSL